MAVDAAGLLQSPETAAELQQVEEDLTGAYLARWEEEQDNARLRLALKSAQRGRKRLRARVAELEQERHTTNNAVAEAHIALAAADEPEPDTPGRRAADAIQAMHDPTVIGCSALTDALLLTLKPRTLADWQAWLDRLGADLAHVTHRGLLSTAKGSWDGVPVAVRAHGVGALLAAARTTSGSEVS